MKTALLTIGLTAVFFCVGTVALLKLGPAANSTTGEEAADSTAAPSVPMVEAAQVTELTAELSELQVRLADAEAQADSLRALMDARQDQQEADVEADAARAGELASTLAKLEGDALGAVVQRLDGQSFTQLYEATSARNRGRLLDALTPTQAAAFVRHHLPGDDRPALVVPVSSSTPDSTSTL
ncbi:hypothetical protein [Rubrivirga sp.]|uniref:hypothetical protein n=1 Tax=Rubrivirga sp. TaxID=1885344 RepID=UPI003C73B92D